MCDFELQHHQDLDVKMNDEEMNEELEYLTKKADEYGKLIGDVTEDYKKLLDRISALKRCCNQSSKRDDKATLVLTKKTRDGIYRISSTRLSSGINVLVLKSGKCGYEKVLEVDVDDEEFIELVEYLYPLKEINTSSSEI